MHNPVVFICIYDRLHSLSVTVLVLLSTAAWAEVIPTYFRSSLHWHGPLLFALLCRGSTALFVLAGK